MVGLWVGDLAGGVMGCGNCVWVCGTWWDDGRVNEVGAVGREVARTQAEVGWAGQLHSSQATAVLPAKSRQYISESSAPQ